VLRVHRLLFVLSILALCASGFATPATNAESDTAQAGTVTMQYLGHSHYRFTSVEGKVILTNPWLSHPEINMPTEQITRADLILVTNGHIDEVGEAIPIALRTGAKIVAPAELNFWFMSAGIPPEQIASQFMSPGDRLDWEGITIRMVNSVHGVGVNAPPGPMPEAPTAGIAAGFFITFENDWTAYFAGSSAATTDMAMWAEMYKPDVAILGLNGGREPTDFAMMVRLLRTGNAALGAIFPHHHAPAFFRGQRPTVAEAQLAVDRMGIQIQVMDPNIGQTFTFTR
jgi:L-ascorbate metabolism protein UlaG (beta-lactamase superfamily)